MKKLKKVASRVVYYAGYVWPVKGYLILALISGLIAAAASGFGIPVLIYKVFPVVFDPSSMPKPILDFIARYVSPENLGKVVLFVACAAMPLIFVVRGLAMWINAMAVNYFGMRVLENLRVGVFSHLQNLPLAFHEKQMRGDILSRIVTDAQNVQNMITQVSSDIVKQPLTAVSAIVALLYVLSDKAEASMFIVSAVFAVIAVVPILIFGKRVVRKARGAQQNIGEMTAVVQENLAAQREIRSYAMEKTQVERMARASNRFCIAQLKTVKYQQLLTPTLEFLTALALAFVLVRGRMLDMELTDFMAIAGALFFAADAIKRTGVSFNKFSQAQASLERLEEILTETDSIPDPKNPQELKQVQGTVEFRNVDFAYNNGRRVLSNVNVHIPAGQTVALVGPSGAGKTTFASLILRFYEATAGSVLVDGIDVRRLRKKNLRSFISLVSQHAVLFRDTIRENIRLGREGASDEDVERAARDAATEDFTLNAGGIDKMLGDVGSGVSGGQRQRLAIARAFLKDAPILILDEATAALDSESEKKIQDKLGELARGRTTFIVAHRFSSIRIAQRILVFSQGRIVGDGSHDELYATCPLYKELYDRQGV